jgi:hypothetical protein
MGEYMASTRLTKEIKETIALKIAKELFVPSLLERWKIVEVQFTSLVKEIFADFDWEHVEPYRKYIRWHDKIVLAEVPSEWHIHGDVFRNHCGLPAIECIHLGFEYPSLNIGTVYLDSAYKKRAEAILRPYMLQYFIAKKYYKDIQQILLGLATYKQLEDTVPELTKYLPQTAVKAVTALVPIEQINRVRNLLQKEAI